jgi:hypothetical protein
MAAINLTFNIRLYYILKELKNPKNVLILVGGEKINIMGY